MLKKKELVYRHVLEAVLEKRELKFTQLSLAGEFGISLSTVNNAVRHLERIGGVSIGRRGFRVADAKKILLYWATARKVDKDIIYSTRVELPVWKIEGLVPPGAVFTAYSGYRMRYGDAPADYSEVYFYIAKEGLGDVKGRFPERKGPPNVLALEGDEWLLHTKTHIAPTAQMYADLWNLKEWYAREFINALEKRLKLG